MKILAVSKSSRGFSTWKSCMWQCCVRRQWYGFSWEGRGDRCGGLEQSVFQPAPTDSQGGSSFAITWLWGATMLCFFEQFTTPILIIVQRPVLLIVAVVQPLSHSTLSQISTSLLNIIIKMEHTVVNFLVLTHKKGSGGKRKGKKLLTHEDMLSRFLLLLETSKTSTYWNQQQQTLPALHTPTCSF